MTRGEKSRVTPVALTRRGAAQLACALALLAVGSALGWHALAAAGAAALLAGVLGLAGVLLARALRSGERRPAGPLAAPERDEDSWVRVDQHGTVIGRPGRLPAERGLYRQRSVILTWRDLFGFWRARRVEATDREVRVPPVADPALVRLVSSRAVARSLDRSAERDACGVRPYERGDGLCQIAWRQSAHHGELMSIETAGSQAPPVLVVADTLGARDADALATTVEALLRGLRRVPDVLLTDGLASWRAPVQQERFLAALVADDDAAGGARVRASLVARLAAGGASRRRVLLVTCDPRGPLATTLSRGPLGRSLVVVEASPGSAAAPAHEGRADAEKDERGEKDERRRPRPEAPAPSVPCELAALPCCCALTLLSMVPFLDMIRDGAWALPVAALLAAGSTAGCALGSALARRRVRPVARVVAAEALALALLFAGALMACALFEARHGFGLPDATAELARAGQGEAADLFGAVRALATAGVAQLGGQPFADADAAWDLLILLGGAALASLCALLASARPTRAAIALVPLGLAAADQSVMGTTDPMWAAGVCALGLGLAWLAAPRDRRPTRCALAVLLACALGAAGAGLASTDAAPAVSLTGGTRIETLVDLSRDLRRNSSAVALTYTTNAGQPLYLRAAVLEDFDGSTWRASTDDDALLDEPLGTGGRVTSSEVTVTTTIQTMGGSSPVPPGTVSVRGTDARTYIATGSYRAPITSVEDVDTVGRFATALSAAGIASSRPTELLVIGGERGEHVSGVIAQARADGVVDSGDQIAVIRWLVDYFTSGGFAYTLDAPGGDGQDNLAVIDDFLAERRGYCTHYATAFTVLARLLGVPARVAMGYQPAGSVSAVGSYEVTMRQLHAWSEVWLDGIGWIGVDVTPAAGDAGDDEPAVPTTPAAPVSPQTPADEPDDAEEEPKPDEPEDETHAPGGAPADGDGTANAPFELPAWVMPALLCLGAAAAAVAATGLVLRARRRRLERGDWDYAWRRVCRVARRARVRWDRSATEQDVAEAICARLEDAVLADAVRRLARNACLARYGARPVGGDGARLPRTLRELARALRHR
ncbi:transglutaminaseTgpA domain-containing protein [Olsenella sp. An293]|uniref:transglutaminaseTgpA domain-containing protein n=1 Tax=Olsenella sp. An293 TaxID=1965626 RepID=UPI000B384ADA|nr:transglutaminaseTgpA domain-containing protein [Olsenella sp. An293]OUO32101.1 hypothetical protein B5F85_08120 [Olsenella sp. An293]